jgi:hypothetical protein
MWLFIDIREQVTSLRNELDQGAVCFIHEVAPTVSYFGPPNRLFAMWAQHSYLK